MRPRWRLRLYPTARQLSAFALLAGVLSAGSWAPSGCSAEEPDAQAGGTAAAELPPPLSEYLGREIAPTMGYQGAPWLIRATREKEESCDELLAALDIEPGQVVCDLGCGNGFYTLQLAELVGSEGRVLAVDIQPEMLSLLDARAKEADFENIEPMLSTVIDPQLPAGELDLVLLVDVYHEFSHPVHMLRALRESLKPEGRIALAEFRLEDPTVPIKRLHKMSKEQILKEYTANGLELAAEYDELPWQHLMFFTRAKEPPDP